MKTKKYFYLLITMLFILPFSALASDVVYFQNKTGSEVDIPGSPIQVKYQLCYDDVHLGPVCNDPQLSPVIKPGPLGYLGINKPAGTAWTYVVVLSAFTQDNWNYKEGQSCAQLPFDDNGATANALFTKSNVEYSLLCQRADDMTRKHG